MNRLKRYEYLRDLVLVLTQKEIKVRYKNSALGYLWSIAHPLAFALVFFVAFKVVMRIQMEDYALFLIAGLFPWQWFSNSINISPMLFVANASIIKKVNFPRNVIPLTAVLQDMIHFVLSVPVIVLFMFVYNKTPFLSWLYGIPIFLVIQLFMTYGLSLIISSINLFVRDLERLTGIFMMLVFYFTPIIYPESMIPDSYRSLVNLNPLAPLMISWRNLFLYGAINQELLWLSILYCLLVVLAGTFVYNKLSWKFAEVL